jgi:hypothetical protein
MRDVQRLFNYAFINIRTENLDPEHLGERFYLGSCPLDETLNNHLCRMAPVQNKQKLLTACYFVLLETCKEPVRSVFDYGENRNREVTDVGPDVTVKANHAHKSTCGLCARGEKRCTCCSTSIQADK